MGRRSKLKRTRRDVAALIFHGEDPDACLKLSSEAVAMGVLKPQKARELLQMRGAQERRKNLPGA